MGLRDLLQRLRRNSTDNESSQERQSKRIERGRAKQEQRLRRRGDSPDWQGPPPPVSGGF
jgi:hypothetical protein